MNRRHFIILSASGLAVTADLVRPRPAVAQFGDMFSAPKTLFDRAIEARSTSDIATDNKIVLKVNKVMADVGSIKASTEIYEQRLLVTGLFDDKPTYDNFEKGVRSVPGVKQLYWHVTYMSEDDQKKNEGNMLGWSGGLEMAAKAKARLLGTKDVADVNYRITSDAFANLYLLGLARSADEKKLALAKTGAGDGVKKVVDYVVVRPKK
jgi:hyperosmotically inducible protein